MDDLDQKNSHELQVSDSSVSIQHSLPRTTKKTISTSKTKADSKFQESGKYFFDNKLYERINLLYESPISGRESNITSAKVPSNIITKECSPSSALTVQDDVANQNPSTPNDKNEITTNENDVNQSAHSLMHLSNSSPLSDHASNVIDSLNSSGMCLYKII